MADNRTMAQMLQAPIEGYEDAIVVPPINANNFELKQPLINLVQSNKSSDTSVKLCFSPFSLDGEARDWLDKEPPRSILTWDDLVSKFINQYFPPSKTTYYRNEIITFYQKPKTKPCMKHGKRFKDSFSIPHHGFFRNFTQLDTFYNSLNSNDQDALDSEAGGNFLDKMPQEGLAIIESNDFLTHPVPTNSHLHLYIDENEPLTEKETEVTKDKVLPSTKDIQPPVIQKSHDPVKPVSSPISPEPSSAQVDNSPPSKEPSKETKLPYPSRVEHEKKGENDKVQIQKFWEMFKKIHVDITLADALILMPKPFLRTARVLIDVHGEELVIRDGMERIVFKPDGSQDKESIHMMDIYDDRVKDVCEPKNDDSPTSTIVDEFESLLEKIIKQKEEVKGISDPAARRKACFKIINQGRVIHSPKKASISAISHIFPNNNLEDSFKIG
ncbi:reverse transcriptase domain-containing protein [Tanacetum coccineum]